MRGPLDPRIEMKTKVWQVGQEYLKLGAPPDVIRVEMNKMQEEFDRHQHAPNSDFLKAFRTRVEAKWPSAVVRKKRTNF